jgi:hypothetical protein
MTLELRLAFHNFLPLKNLREHMHTTSAPRRMIMPFRNETRGFCIGTLQMRS